MSESNASALSALGKVQEVSANNVANMNTDGFKASSVALETGPGDNGVRVSAISQSTAPGPLAGEVELSNTDVGGEMTTMMTTETAFDANTVAFRVSEEMTGHIIDMLA